MDQFDKDFQDALDRNRPFQAERADWADMEARLNHLPGRAAPRWHKMAPAVFAVLALLVTSWGWWYNAQKVEALRQAVNSMGWQNAEQVPRPRPAVVLYDTVYRTVIVEKHTQPGSGKNGPSRGILREKYTENGANQKNTAPPLMVHAKRSIIGEISGAAASHTGGTSRAETPDESAGGSSESSETGASRVLPALPLHLRPPAPLFRKSLPVMRSEISVTPLTTVRPHRDTRFATGVSLGLYTAREMHESGGLFAWHGRWRFAKHLHIVGEMRLSVAQHSVGERERMIFSIPVQPAPAPGFDLSHINRHHRHAAAGLGLRWQFRPESRWQPYVSAGFFGGCTLKNAAQYIFSHPDGTRVAVERTISTREDVALWGQGSLGVERRQGQRFSVGAEALVWPGVHDPHPHHPAWRGALRGYIFYNF